MSTQHIGIGVSIRWRENGQEAAYRIIRLLPRGKVNIENIFTTGLREVDVSVLVEALFKGDLPIVESFHKATSNNQRPIMDLEDFTEFQQKLADYRFAVIKPLLAVPAEERSKSKVKARVKVVRKENHANGATGLLAAVSATSIYRWIRLYEQSGGDKRALLVSTLRGGRKKTRLTEEVESIIDSVFENLYFSTRTLSGIDDIHQEVIRIINERNQYRPAHLEKLAVPSRATIARRQLWLDSRKRYEAKHGKRAAKRMYDQLNKMGEPQYPLERVEIDHTRANLIVIDDEDDLPLGRFTLTVCIDVATRYILGFYLGFEPPGYYTVMECLYRVILPKTGFREKYGLQHGWQAYGVPATLIVDNGKEFRGNSLDDACFSLGITLIHAPVLMPEFKPFIERYLGTMATMFLRPLPGTTFSNPQRRGDYDSAGEACLYMSEVEKILIKGIVGVYAEKPHRGLGGNIPARRWEAAINAGFIPPLPASAEDVRILLGRVFYRTINRYGIEFETLRYNTPELSALRVSLVRRGEKAKCKFHPGDLSRIYVFDPDNSCYIEVPACDLEGYTQNLSLWKHQVVR
jgi:putative transposase